MDAPTPGDMRPRAVMPAHAATPATAVAPRAARQRIWPALLFLYFLTPLIAETIASYNTPPLAYLNPLTIVFLSAFYGSAAILTRELVRRRGLGWASWLLLGAAFGALNEGVIAVTWFDPRAPGFLSVYGHALGVNWVWALGLTVFHTVYSIIVPIVLAELAFPRIARQPWLGPRAFRFFVILLALATLLGFVVRTYELGRLAALLWAIALVTLALRLPRARVRRLGVLVARAAPPLWGLRLFGFAGTVSFFAALFVVPHLLPWPVASAAVMAGTAALALWCVRVWTGRAGWGQAQALALASGALGLGIVLSPTRLATGMPLVAAAFLALLVWLARRTPSTAGG